MFQPKCFGIDCESIKHKQFSIIQNRQIRKFNRNVVIIPKTAYGLSGDRERAIEAGCNDYISKPINQATFNKVIEKHFNKYKNMLV